MVSRFSIDDLYKSHAERQQPQKQDHRLIWRGPPVTHDVNLGIEILEQFLQSDLVDPIFVLREAAVKAVNDALKERVDT